MASPAFVNAWTSIFGPAVVCAPRDEPARRPNGARLRETPNEHTVSQSSPDASSRFVEIDGVAVSAVLARLREGERDALTMIHGALHVPLWRFAVILTGNTSLAEEMVQELFFSLWLRREMLDPAMDVRAYLYAAKRNQARQMGRHARVVSGVESAVDRGTLAVPALGQSFPAPDRDAEANEFSEAFHRALGALSDREREALQLRVEGDLTFDELGRLFGMSKMGAHKLVARTEAKMRALLAAYRP